MHLLTLNLSDNVRIEVENSLTRLETIKYNGEVVSEKRSFLGEHHEFERNENGDKARYDVRVSLKNLGRVSVDVYRNNKAIVLN